MSVGIGWGGMSPVRALLRGAAAVGLLCLPAVPAWASDRITVNQTDAYVDPSISAAFVTTPNICTEPVGTQGTSPDGCNALGDAAVLAATGSGPDVYFESHTTPLATRNAFVPGNSGSAVNNTGYAPLFSDHKYDLFGRAGDRMGLLTRREILFMDNIPTTGGGITVGQTVPGEDTLLALVVAVLIQSEGATTINLRGFTFQVSDLPTYERLTGFTSGKLATITAYCEGIFGAVPCASFPDEFKAQLYLATYFPELFPDVCGTKQNDLQNLANCGNRDAWMDQAVVAYAASWDSLGGDDHFAQNFRSQVGYDGLAANLDATTEVWTDFRLEQSVELSGAFTTEATDPGDAMSPANMDNIAGRQTFRQTIATESLDSFGFLRFPGAIAQMVAQDVNGYFMSCLNCDTATTAALNDEHAFTPAKLDLTFMPYTAGWQTVPTITHAP
jgi:hypothetical protein